MVEPDNEFSLREAVAFWRRDLPEPVHMLNFSWYANKRVYMVYGLLVRAFLQSVGATIRWAGYPTRVYRGPMQAEQLVLVEYPSHRRFVLMVLNPLYQLINVPRTIGRGENYELSATSAPEHDADLWRHEHVLAVHFNGEEDSLEGVKAAVPAEATFVYSSYEVSEVPGEDPATVKRNAFFAVDSPDVADELVTDDLLESLATVCDGYRLHLYERGFE